MVTVRGAGGGRVSIAGVACYRPGDRPHLFYQLRVYRRRKGEAKGFTWADYRDLILATHRALPAPLVWVWDNLNIHLAQELAGFAQENEAWLRIYRLPAYTAFRTGAGTYAKRGRRVGVAGVVVLRRVRGQCPARFR